MSTYEGQGARPIRVTASGNATVSGKGRLVGISVAGGTALTSVFDALTQAGSAIAEVTAPSNHLSFGQEGIEFNTGLSITLGAGATSAIVYVKQ